MKRFCLVLLVTLAVVPLLGQANPKNEKPAPSPSAAQAAPPQLTETQRLQVENLQLKNTLLQRQMAEIQAEFSALVEAIDKEHPGWLYNPQAGQFVPKPKAEGKPEGKK